MTAEERQILLAPPSTGEELIKKLEVIFEDQNRKATRPKWQQKSSEFFVRFCGVVSKTSGMIQTLLPQSPEYTVTFGLLAVLFRAVVTKNDREEALMENLEALASKLPVVEFYRSTFPTNGMKLAVANIFSEVTRLLEEAIIYYRSSRTGQLAADLPD